MFIGIGPDANLIFIIFRLLCALEGKYLVHDSCHDLVDGADVADAAIQHLRFSCHIPNVNGRGFIEVVSCTHTPNFSKHFFVFLFSNIKPSSGACF